MIKRGVAWHRWKKLLSGYWNSRLSLSEYCRQHDLNLKTASKWRLRFQAEHPMQEKPLEIVQLPSSTTVSSLQSLAPSACRGDNSGIQLEFGQMHIKLAVDFNTATLRRVLSILEVK